MNYDERMRSEFLTFITATLIYFEDADCFCNRSKRGICDSGFGESGCKFAFHV